MQHKPGWKGIDVAEASKCLVVDANIARSAGNADALDATSKTCRAFLIGVRDTDHRIVSSEAIRDEWHKHQSNFARTLLVSMVARKKVCWVKAPANDELRGSVQSLSQSEREEILRKQRRIQEEMKKLYDEETAKQRAESRVEAELNKCQNKCDAMLKDMHLIEAAIEADKIVISMDEIVRTHFQEIADMIGIIKQIAWVNPCEPQEKAIEWLQDGAELERKRLLGYQMERDES
jgi:hypothetical protein